MLYHGLFYPAGIRCSSGVGADHRQLIFIFLFQQLQELPELQGVFCFCIHLVVRQQYQVVRIPGFIVSEQAVHFVHQFTGRGGELIVFGS